MFAVLKTGGKQYKVTNGDILRVEKLAAVAGDTVQFNEILMVGETVGEPFVEDAGVQAEVIDQIKGDKVIHFVKRRRKHGSKRTKGHRQQLTLLRVTEVLESGAANSGVKAAIGAGSAPHTLVSDEVGISSTQEDGGGMAAIPNDDAVPSAADIEDGSPSATETVLESEGTDETLHVETEADTDADVPETQPDPSDAAETPQAEPQESIVAAATQSDLAAESDSSPDRSDEGEDKVDQAKSAAEN